MTPPNPALAAGRRLAKAAAEPDPAEMRPDPDPAVRDDVTQLPGTGVPATETGPAEHWPVHLDRREPRESLNVALPWSLRHGVRLLAMRDGTDQQDEVAEALRAWFAAKKFTPPSFWDHG